MEMKGFKEAPLQGETLGMRKEGSYHELPLSSRS